MKIYSLVPLLIIISAVLVACSPSNSETSPIVIGTTPESESVVLDWKLNPGEVIAYKTAMNQIDNKDVPVSFDLTDLFASVGEQVNENMFSFTIPASFSYVSLLELNDRSNITVRMVFDKARYADSPSSNEVGMNKVFSELMTKMEGTEQLRGEITPDGAISSFYLESRQRNLLAIFFQLPTTPVQVGDHWSLDFNCISMGAGYNATNAAKLNRVTLSALSQTADGRPLAILDYVLAEKVEGGFQSPLANQGTPVPSAMTCWFLGRGEFLINEGRWQQMTGQFAISSTGFMASNSVEQFALSPLGPSSNTDQP